MSKDHFHFKHFSINQKCATLKVCTDSCLFGAWSARESSKTRSVLDIGSGTGLLALMFAQQHSESAIDAIEIDSESAELTKNNFSGSVFSQNLHSFNTSLQEYLVSFKRKYETIICNPPFFENQLISKEKNKNLAKHNSALSKEELLAGINCLLSGQGEVFILLPPAEAEVFIRDSTKQNIYLSKIAKVRNFDDSECIRYMLKFQRTIGVLQEEYISVYSRDKVYSPEFIDLLSSYYLYL